MFDHVRSRNRTAGVFLISLAVFVPALVIPRSSEVHTGRTLLLFVSLASTLISGVVLTVLWHDAKRLLRLRAGEGILARWTIDAARWEWFRGHSNEWDKREGTEPNNVDFTQNAGESGIDVVVSRDGILIGKDFQPLERDVRITVRADWMEFYQIIPKPKGPALHVALRLPLQPGKEALATDIQQAYQGAYKAAASDRRPLIYVALFCLVGLPAVTALMFFVAKVTGWVE